MGVDGIDRNPDSDCILIVVVDPISAKCGFRVSVANVDSGAILVGALSRLGRPGFCTLAKR